MREQFLAELREHRDNIRRFAVRSLGPFVYRRESMMEIYMQDTAEVTRTADTGNSGLPKA